MNSKRQRELAYAERAGLVCEEIGLPRMAGRIVGWLLICDPAHQSLAELGEVLQASKGSISTTTRLLMGMGLLERVSLPGDRRDYVRIQPGSWFQMMNRYQRETDLMRRLAEEGLEILGKSPPDRRARLDEMRDLYDFLARIAPEILGQWERERAAKNRK